MRLYLVRHADAVSEDLDPARPLSEKGRHESGVVASHLLRLNIPAARILHSPKLRAKQTAEIIAGSLREGYRAKSLVVEVTDGLSPLDNPAVWGERLRGIHEDIMLVGHLPHLERLASLLLCGDPGKDVVSFSTAGTACLERGGEGGWSLVWMITPGTLSTCLTVDDLGSVVHEGDAGI